MSFDLFLKLEDRSLAKSEIKLFRDGNYNNKKDQYVYENSETGVYFIVQVNLDEAGEDEDPGDISLNINFNRPLCFIDEVIIELNKLYEIDKFLVMDPQGDEDKFIKYNENRLRENYIKSSKWAFGAMRSDNMGTSEDLYLPDEKIVGIWKWNYTRNQRGIENNGAQFIPLINYCKVDGCVKTFCIWPDCLPSNLPKCDFILIPRKIYAPKKLGIFRGPQDMCKISYNELLNVFGEFVKSDGVVDFSYVETPSKFKRYVMNLRKFEGKIDRISFDSVFNESCRI